MIHEARTTPVDGRPPLDPEIKQWMGESRGYWDGATLVVETTNFSGKIRMLIAGIPARSDAGRQTRGQRSIARREV